MPRILVIDDEPIYHKLIQHALEPHGLEIVVAEDGNQGLAAVSTYNPDGIIIDVMMPDLSGYEVAQRIRQDIRFTHTPIIILTSQNELTDKLKAFDAGADDYMSKPFEPDELIARLGVLLRRSAQMKQSQDVRRLGGKNAKIFTVHSLRGGLGCTSIATNLGLAFWKTWEQPTLIIDSIQLAGQVPIMLNVSLKRTWANIADIDPSDLEFELLESIINKHESGLHLLAGPNLTTQLVEVKNGWWEKALALLKDHYEYIVIDTSHDFSEVTVNMLDAADHHILVVAPDMASIRSGVASIYAYHNLGYDTKDNFTLIVNRIYEKFPIKIKQIERVLVKRIDITIPYEPDNFLNAINLGSPVLERNPKAESSEIFENLAYQLSKEEHINIPQPTPTATWKKVSKRLN
jgi:pilus assembly protein CpaE